MVDTNGTAAKFDAIENNVVGLGAEFRTEFSLEEFFLVFLDRTRKGMVDGRPALFFFVPAEKREFNHPKEIAFRVAFEDFHEIGTLEANATEDIARLFPVSGGKEDEIARFDIQAFRQSLDFIFGKKLRNRTLPAVFAYFDVGQPFGSGFHGRLCKGINLTDGGI